ncbi:Ribonuclease H-like domain protein [Kalmanozyma brasiliensis GHG001]|uniref:RNase H type-1 domain-containing protein n=1 Tax=Kalmanozyma brasiliensis (strain GHG001) TaxID=1365824 RepID=V5E8G7_KALBG|nr:Ribonuclease H-like domain protein [Kalmanozyma brasiliensis GHG001]EST06581.1 Ribonuclease H-like domain protein [Kalmanozyma brasiliensis GHG001]
MSAPDYRYLQAWARPSASKSSTSASSSRRPYESGTSYEVVLPTSEGDTSTQAAQTLDKDTQQQSAYQVRLDVPGGISYAPDALAQHNSVKRLFIPAKMHDRSAQEYDFAREIEAKRKASASKQEPELDDQGRTQAQAYKDSVEQQNPNAEATAPIQGDVAAPFEIPDGSIAAPADNTQAKDSDAASIATNATAASAQSKITTYTLVAGRTQTLPKNVTANAVAAPFRPPPSILGDAGSAQTPWTASSTWTSHRALDRITDKEKKAGITQFEEASEGRVPSAYEASLFPASSASDAATVRTARMGELLAEDLFVPDPRPWRPLRYVRKIDPRQMLILCAGAALTPGQVAALKLGSDASSILTTNTSAPRKGPSDAASIYSSIPTDFSVEATRKAMFGAGKLPDYKSLEAQLNASSPVTGVESEEKRAGLGFVFCPTHDPRSRQPAYQRAPEVTVEPNFSRRLERPPDFAHSTVRRAALRSALAALEFNKWESEGFDKIVIATHHGWLVDGISRWIWEWRHNKWRIMAESPLGMIGEQVPDRDLWELLDKVVKGYEDIDCTVRFWKISKEQNAQAVMLAQEGACKDNQQPGTVRWTKKKVPAST